MNQTEALKALLGSVQSSTKLLDRIKELFVVHQNTMRTRDLDAIEQSNTDLAEHLMLLRDSFAQRVDLQKTLCPDLTEESWSAFMESLPERPKAVISKAWNSLDETLAEVQRLSQINQQVVRRGQRQIDDLVSILQGKGRTNKIYNQQGASGHVNPQSTIGKA